MNQALYDRLKDVARSGQIAYYSDVAPLVNLDMSQPPDREEIGRLLGEISESEHRQDRPLLSAVIISREGNRPGDGFFTLARSLRLHPGGDDTAYWIAEVQRVWDYWKRH